MEKDIKVEVEKKGGWGIVEVLDDRRVARMLRVQAEILKSTDEEKEMGFGVYLGKRGTIKIIEMREVEADSVQLGLAGAVEVSRLREQGYVPVADVHFHTSSGGGVYGAGVYALSAADLINHVG